jgi:regulator of nucleoside diphosphate kinase
VAEVLPKIFLTTLDAERLERVLAAFRSRSYQPLTGFLSSELRRATIIDPQAVCRCVVTMNSHVRFRLDGDDAIRESTLVCPGREDSLMRRISVLTPVGAALIGMREGETIVWNGFDRQRRSVMVLKVLYQPEADGRWSEADLPDGISGCLTCKICYIC